MSFTVADALPILARTPRTLDALLAGLPAAWVDADAGPDTWSARLVVAHLLHADDAVWMPRARLLRDAPPGGAEPPPFAPFDREGHRRTHADTPLPALLDAFARTRHARLAEVEGWRLDDAALAHAGVHPAFGPVTLRQLLAAWATHDLGHVAQVARVLAKRHTAAVGPWRAYLSILDR